MDQCARTRVFGNPEGGEDITALCTLRLRHGWNHVDEMQGLSWDADGYLADPEALRSHVRDPHFRMNVLLRTSQDGPGDTAEELLEGVAGFYPGATVQDVHAAMDVWWELRRQVCYTTDGETRRYIRLLLGGQVR